MTQPPIHPPAIIWLWTKHSDHPWTTGTVTFWVGTTISVLEVHQPQSYRCWYRGGWTLHRWFAGGWLQQPAGSPCGNQWDHRLSMATKPDVAECTNATGSFTAQCYIWVGSWRFPYRSEGTPAGRQAGCSQHHQVGDPTTPSCWGPSGWSWWCFIVVHNQLVMQLIILNSWQMYGCSNSLRMLKSWVILVNKCKKTQ